MSRWIGFNLLIALLLLLDLGVFQRKRHALSLKEASLWSIFWIGLALIFNLFVYTVDGPEKALEFFTGYVVEKSLSVDNLFIFLVIFSHFKVPHRYQHLVLFEGIVGALIMRLGLILAGTALVQAFHFVLYIFAAVLAYTGFSLVFKKKKETDIEDRLAVRVVRKIFPVTTDYHNGNFFVRQKGRLYATPLLLVLVVMESADFIFALDSIPAIFAITLDPFIIYSSNVFAILGLRALFFVLMHFLGKFRYLKVGLGVVLVFIAAKMAVVKWYTVPLGISLLIIALILLISIAWSWIGPRLRPRSKGRD
jgi:tellurite resistance protein TerC